MLSIVRVLCIFIAVRRADCIERHCVLDPVSIKSNSSKGSLRNFTVSSAFNRIVNYDEWNQVIRNDTSDNEDLPHNLVPQISSYEKGRQKKVLKKCADRPNRRYANFKYLPKEMLAFYNKTKFLGI